MTPIRQDRLYNLLPALYRQLDERQGQPLRVLMNVLESEFLLLEGDIEAMYDDWFIETCDLWVVPYIADLLGVRHLQDIYQIPSQRRLVANSIAYRRRKGTLAILEKVARDATGWHACAVEYPRLIANTQHVARVQPENGRTVDMHHLYVASTADEALGSLAHTVDIDNSNQAEYNLDRVGLFLYRLRSYPVIRSYACKIKGIPGCFTFDPFGRDIPLFNQPQPVLHISQRSQPVNLPLRINRADLAADLQEYRKLYGHLLKSYQPEESCYYGPDRSLHIELPSNWPSVKPSAVISKDLSQWPAVLSLPARAVVAVDVELGRIAFIDQKHLPDQMDIDVEQCTIDLEKKQNWPSYVIVNYNYGFSTELGGGPYHREIQLQTPAKSMFQINVAKGSAKGTSEDIVPGCVPTLTDALAYWDKLENPRGVIRILDNGVYDEKLVIKLPKGRHLSIVASPGVRPIIGNSKNPIIVDPVYPKMFKLTSAGPQVPLTERQLHLNGLLLQGGLQIKSEERSAASGRLNVTIEHCTLVKSELDKSGKVNLKPAPVQSEKTVQGLDLNIESSILGPVYLPARPDNAKENNLRVSYSIVDNGSGYAIAGLSGEPGPSVNLERTTIFGRVYAQKVVASDVIFGGPLKAPAPETKDQIQHSYVPQGSTTLEGEPHSSISIDIAPPSFTSTRYGDPAYGQLSLDCPRQIRGGAPDGSEMGAFHDLHQLLAHENLHEILEEYLPIGLHASIHYVT